MKFTIVVFLICFIFCLSTSAQQIIPLYNTAIPNSKPAADKEKSEINKDGILIVSHVSIPTITMYVPANASSQHSAVIICPGGAYAFLAAGHEGIDVAKQFNEWGITAFVLKYRIPDDSIMIDKTIAPLQDAQRAIQLVREHATEWNIDTAKIGIMGFSAGGHLASTASTHFTHALIDNPLHTSLRPDFSILIYPVISFSDSLKHTGSRNNLIGYNPSEKTIATYSNELQVTPQTPKAFLVHAGDDAVVSVNNSVRYYEALLKNGIYGELLLYPQGGHGFGMNNKTTPDKWMDHLKNWMLSNKYL